eukprot:c2926_g1_i1.p1 GENE.c2926_g1_i1~~c2926_g1_i1.p1  ORF type:complete len:895 (-),score=214.58 c2926_g1_i1:66-2720(-)
MEDTNFTVAPSSKAINSPSKRKPRVFFILAIALGLVAVLGCVYLAIQQVSQGPISLKNRLHVRDDGIVVKVGNDTIVELAVASLTTFRLGVSYTTSPPYVVDNPMLIPQTSKASFVVFQNGTVAGIRTSFGSISIDAASGAFVFTDENNVTLTSSSQLSHYISSADVLKSSKGDTCTKTYPGFDMTGGSRTPKYPNGLQNQTQESCCQACNDDPDCTTWVWAWPQHEYQGYDCWTLSGTTISLTPADYRTTGGAVVPPPPQTKVDLGKTSSTKFYGSGGGGGDVNYLSKTSSYPQVSNTAFYIPYYYSSDGYSALTVSSYSYRESLLYAYPAQWDLTSDTQLTWSVDGPIVNMYLTPARSHAIALNHYWGLTGRPVLPPRYIFGFLACRWGWQSYDYVVDMLTSFRNGSYPIDGWISDFEWYTNTPDYSLPDTGLPDFYDFTYNAPLFPDPVNNIAMYHDQFKMRFGGIRKPRLGNSDLLTLVKANGWNVDANAGAGAPGGTRNLNFSIPELRDWYVNNTQHFLEDGVDFYWDDEGETYYFAFYWWNMAQTQGLTKFDPKRRFFTINRSFTPGMQRLGAYTWSGDIDVSWDSLGNQPGYVANWGFSGTPYVACDIGGFNGDNDSPLLMTRWYQIGVFMPLMRVHSSYGNLPHFPFLYGEEAGNAMRKAMNLRYQLVPYHYSLGHATFLPGGLPINRPLVMHYPNDPNVQEMTVPWLDGPSLVVCAVVKEDNSSSCYLPEGVWYSFNSTTQTTGPVTLTLQNVPLDEIPVYAAAGAIIPLAPIIQYTDQLPGGPLQLHVYGGLDGEFTMVEDDGETTAYAEGVTRSTTFRWDDSIGALSWIVSGTFSDAHTFREVQITVFTANGPVTSGIIPLFPESFFSIPIPK